MKDLRRLDSLEYLYRLRLDYSKSKADVLNELRHYLPQLTDDELNRLADDEEMDYRIIDGDRRYFNSAVKNFLRRTPQYQDVAIANGLVPSKKREQFMRSYIPQCLALGEEKHFLFDFRLSVNSEAVVDGEKLRCWLPIPRRDLPYQKLTKIEYNIQPKIVAAPDAPHSSAYFEINPQRGSSIEFSYVCEVTLFPQLFKNINRQTVDLELSTNALNEYLSECAPHIIFTDEMKSLAAEIIQQDDTPFVKARKIFCWIADNFPWTSSHEYSTTQNIPLWVLRWRSGDCGEKSLLYITLCRICGIPARWQSGFMLHPGFDNLHDWVEIFLCDVGWVPVDVSFGTQKYLSATDERDFFFGNRDAYHLVVNSDVGEQFSPLKTFVRSETVDFQRGEVENEHQNLYFDHWNWHFTVKYLD